MTREEHLKFCRICQNRKFDSNQGIICGLTSLAADFEFSCEYFKEDWELEAKQKLKLQENEIVNKTASANVRFLNYILDLLFIYLFSFIFGALLGIVIALVSPEYLAIFDEGILVNYILGFISIMLYYSIFEGMTGRSIAKFITKTKVINVYGDKPEIGTILIRTLCRFIPFEAFSFLGSETSGWHDTISKTRVVEV